MEDQEEHNEVSVTTPCEGCMFIVIVILLSIIACLYWGKWGQGLGTGAQVSEKEEPTTQPTDVVINEVPQLNWPKEAIEKKIFAYGKAKIDQHEYLLITYSGGWGGFQAIHSESCPCKRGLPQTLIAEENK